MPWTYCTYMDPVSTPPFLLICKIVFLGFPNNTWSLVSTELRWYHSVGIWILDVRLLKVTWLLQVGRDLSFKNCSKCHLKHLKHLFLGAIWINSIKMFWMILLDPILDDVQVTAWYSDAIWITQDKIIGGLWAICISDTTCYQISTLS